MYISSGSVDDVLTWFHKEARFRFLLLFAAGEVSSARFFASLFDQKETIDLISSREIAVFLFYDGTQSALEMSRTEGHLLLVPGQRLNRDHGWRSDRQFRPIRITDIEGQDLRHAILRRSISITHEIVETFDLDPEDIPALILLTRDNPEPIVIRTRGEEDIHALLQLLRELRAIRLPTVELPGRQKKNARRRLRAARVHVETIGRQLDKEVSQFNGYLSSVAPQEPPDLMALTRENASAVNRFRAAWEPGEVPQGDTQELGALARVRADPHFQILCDRVSAADKRYRAVLVSTRKAERRVSHYETLAVKFEQAVTLTHSLEGQIEKVAKQYERRFRLQHFSSRFLRFARAFVGIAKHTKDLADATTQVQALLGDSGRDADTPKG